MAKVYLGDGCYAEHDGYAIELTTEDGFRVTNRIVLEPQVCASLVSYVKTLAIGAEKERVLGGEQQLSVVTVKYARLSESREQFDCSELLQ